MDIKNKCLKRTLKLQFKIPPIKIILPNIPSPNIKLFLIKMLSKIISLIGNKTNWLKDLINKEINYYYLGKNS